MHSVQDENSSTELMIKDKGDELYKKSKILDLGNTITFWSIVALSAARVAVPDFLPDWLSTLQVISVILNITFWIANDYFILYKAERERRKLPIQYGFGVQLTDYTKDGYFDNQFPPSEQKYFVDIYESNYYSNDTSGKMIPYAILKTILAICVLLLTIWKAHDPALVLVPAEAVFSSSVLMKTIAVCEYRKHMSELIDIPYRIFITEGKIGTAQRAMLFDYAVEYEAVKAHYKVLLDNNIYKKNKKRLEKEWKELEDRINHKIEMKDIQDSSTH